MLTRTSGLELPKDHPDYIRIESDLNRTLRGFTGDLTYVKFYKDLGASILIPRFYPVLGEINDQSNLGLDIEIECTLTPRNKRQEKYINFLVEHNNGIIKADPGAGKTAIAISAISQIKKKTIIFVHKEALRRQWTDEFIKFTNIKIEEIGFLSTKTYKQALQKPIIITTVQAVGALLKRRKDEFLKELNAANIGVSIFDEIHNLIGPEFFSDASIFINTKRVYGLSATPYRSDGCEDIIIDHVGEIVYFEPEEGELLKPIVYMIYFSFGIYETPKQIKYLTWGGNFSTPRYFQQMNHSEKYKKTVTKLTEKLIKDKRNVLVLGVRINCLLELAGMSTLSKSEIGIFIPGTSKEERLKYSDTDDLKTSFETKQLVFSTYSNCRDGVNRKNLDALIMSCPTANIEQSIGRILRTLDGKRQPIVLDLIDIQGPMYNIDGKMIPYFVRSSRKRYNFYKEKDWIVKEIVLED